MAIEFDESEGIDEKTADKLAKQGHDMSNLDAYKKRKERAARVAEQRQVKQQSPPPVAQPPPVPGTTTDQQPTNKPAKPPKKVPKVKVNECTVDIDQEKGTVTLHLVLPIKVIMDEAKSMAMADLKRGMQQLLKSK